MSLMNSYFQDSATLIVETRDHFKVLTNTASTAFKCRYVAGNKLVIDAEGEQVLSTAQVLAPPDLTIQSGNKVLINGTRRTVIGVEPKKDFSDRYKEVFLR